MCISLLRMAWCNRRPHLEILINPRTSKSGTLEAWLDAQKRYSKGSLWLRPALMTTATMKILYRVSRTILNQNKEIQKALSDFLE